MNALSPQALKSPQAVSLRDWTVIASVNNETLVKNCLLNSPDIRFASEVILQRDYASAAVAYNDAIEKAKTDLLVFVHQDVYLPEGWFSTVQNAMEILSKSDPDWGVLGVWGIRPSGEAAGFVYDGYGRCVLGNHFEGGLDVESLDELLLIMRKSSGLRFDEKLEGFHMYGTDICLEAKHRGIKCYAIAAFCVHNTSQYWMLPLGFWRAYLTIRRKWKSHLPIKTACTKITRWCWPMIRWNVVRAINLITGRDKPPIKRVKDPVELYRMIVNSGKTISSMSFGLNMPSEQKRPKSESVG